jgi:hypothetical protein
MGIADLDGLDRLDPREREYVQSLDGEERDVVVSTLLRYRRRDGLRVGDRVPTVKLHRLEDGGAVHLDDLVEPRPLVLVFGSFT